MSVGLRAVGLSGSGRRAVGGRRPAQDGNDRRKQGPGNGVCLFSFGRQQLRVRRFQCKASPRARSPWSHSRGLCFLDLDGGFLEVL